MVSNIRVFECNVTYFFIIYKFYFSENNTHCSKIEFYWLILPDMAKLKIYTDGASRGNPGRGGYGIVLIYNNHQKELSQGFRYTTNNRMELMAVIKALESLKTNQEPIDLFTDSKYVIDAVEKGWLQKWIATDFKGGKKNKDLWTRYFHLSRQFTIHYHWIKGHAENVYNNRCDELATKAADGNNLMIDEVFEEKN